VRPRLTTNLYRRLAAYIMHAAGGHVRGYLIINPKFASVGNFTNILVQPRRLRLALADDLCDDRGRV